MEDRTNTMTTALVSAWHPRGETGRFQKLLPVLREVYGWIVITLPPDADGEALEALNADGRNLTAIVTPEWPMGRYLALKGGLETGADFIHYADFDRLLRWVETDRDEWRKTVDGIKQADVTIVGRTAAAYHTHPQALIQTEAISNRVVSEILGQEVDASAGSKSFSRRAAAYLVEHASTDQPFGADAEWPILLQRAGFSMNYLEVDGLAWESADRFMEEAADHDGQRRAAQAYDADPGNWAYRVKVAQEIVRGAYAAVGKGRKITPLIRDNSAAI